MLVRRLLPRAHHAVDVWFAAWGWGMRLENMTCGIRRRSIQVLTGSENNLRGSVSELARARAT